MTFRLATYRYTCILKQDSVTKVQVFVFYITVGTKHNRQTHLYTAKECSCDELFNNGAVVLMIIFEVVSNVSLLFISIVLIVVVCVVY